MADQQADESYRPREVARTVAAALESMPVVGITGMRQTGKTTMLLNEPSLSGREHISLDDIATLAAVADNAKAVIGGREKVTIDEAQRHGDLFLAIKTVVDGGRKPGQFLLSGSSSFDLRKGIKESLAGRAIYFKMNPMTAREITGATGEPPFLLNLFEGALAPVERRGWKAVSDDDVLRGGLPRVALGMEKDPSLWFEGFESTYLERDVSNFARIANIFGFRDLMHMTALRTAQVLNISGLARDVGLPVNTAYRYMGFLDESFVTRRIPAFRRSLAKRIVKAPKIVSADSGLACHLCDCRDLTSGTMRGQMYETYVAQNLLGIAEAHLRSANLYYWRTDGGHEVDFVLENGKEIIAVEVKASATWNKRDLSGLRAFLEAFPGCRAGVLAYNGTETLKLDDRLLAVPIGLLLS
jgi:predicted AAA+ superfamily ATPase